MPRPKPAGVKSSLTVALVAHVLAILVIFVWAARTDRLPAGLRELVAVIIPPAKKEEPPPPPPVTPPPPQETTEPSTQPETPPDQPANTPPTASVADPNAPPSLNSSPFAAEARRPGQAPVPLIQGAGTGSPVATAGPKPETRRPTPTAALETTKPSTIARVLEERKKAVAVSDAIGSEQISKSGTSDAGEIVAKVTGTSVVDGKHVVVRGLSDRYTTTTLNGADIPSADPYRKSVQLDLFPASLIDSIVVNKTQTPDQPGGFAGGAINVVTKSFPEKFTFSLSAGLGYNEGSNLRDDFLTYAGGSKDWQAKDDGTRAMPERFSDPNYDFTLPTLGPANDPVRRAQADKLAADAVAFGSREFGPSAGDSPLNHSMSLAVGDTLLLGGRPFGLAGGLSYNREYQLYTDSIRGRYDAGLRQTRLFLENRGVEQTSWSTFLNLAYKPLPDHQFDVNMIYNRSADDMARHMVGTNFTAAPDTLAVRETLHYTERSLKTTQFKGAHTLPYLGNSRFEWLGSLTTTGQDEPDLRYFNYFESPTGERNFSNDFDPNFPQRVFRTLEEKNSNWKADYTIPFGAFDLDHSLKFGVYTSNSERDFTQRAFTYQDSSFRNGNPTPNEFLDDQYIGYDIQRLGTRARYNFDNYRRITSDVGNSFYFGEQQVDAGYAMTDFAIAPKLRLIGGARIERTDLSITGTHPTLGSLSTNILSNDLLPSAGLIYAINPKMNLRLNFGESLARPAYREIAPYQSYDPIEDEILVGNPGLTLSQIKNYDLRWEWFPRPGEVYSISLFYKDLQKPIEKFLERQDGSAITYKNREDAIVYGIEFEIRQALDFIDPLLREFSLGLNAALIESEVELTPEELSNKRRADPTTEAVRPLYDQSPYLINADLTYSNPYLGTSVTLLASLAGERIYIASAVGQDIYESPPVSLDVIVSQRLNRNWRLRLSVKNLLDPEFERNYGQQEELIYSSYKKGISFGLSVTYQY